MSFQNPKGAESYRAKKVRLFENNVFVREFGTIKECASFIGCAPKRISEAIIRSKAYKQYTFEEGGAE